MIVRSFAASVPPLLIVALVGCGSNDTPSGDHMTEKREPPTIRINADDAEMTAAMEQARSTVDEFIDALSSPKPSQSRFSVKVAVKDGDHVEHLWLVPVRYENGKFIG